MLCDSTKSQTFLHVSLQFYGEFFDLSGFDILLEVNDFIVFVVDSVLQIMHLPLQIDDEQRIFVQIIARLIQLIDEFVPVLELVDHLCQTSAQPMVVLFVVIEGQFQRDRLVIQVFLVVVHVQRHQFLAVLTVHEVACGYL